MAVLGCRSLVLDNLVIKQNFSTNAEFNKLSSAICRNGILQSTLNKISAICAHMVDYCRLGHICIIYVIHFYETVKQVHIQLCMYRVHQI